MDYPYIHKQRSDISNNWWYLPADLYKIENDKENTRNSAGSFPLVDYLDLINNKDKFRFGVIAVIVIVFFYHINFHSSVWIGFVVAMGVVYYINERNRREVGSETEQLWNILTGDLLKDTKYFITDPELIRWASDVGELKKFNVLEFNIMIRTLDKMLRFVFDVKRGVTNFRETFRNFKDLKTLSLNQFHSFVHKIPFPTLRRKYNYHLSELGKHLNTHHANMLQINKLFNGGNPVNIDSHFGEPTLDDPVPIDSSWDPKFCFFN